MKDFRHWLIGGSSEVESVTEVNLLPYPRLVVSERHDDGYLDESDSIPVVSHGMDNDGKHIACVEIDGMERFCLPEDGDFSRMVFTLSIDDREDSILVQPYQHDSQYLLMKEI